MQALMSAKLNFARARISLSHGAYSSAVRLGSVEARHWPRHDLPSWTANLVLVLPTSMARSMGIRPRCEEGRRPPRSGADLHWFQVQARHAAKGRRSALRAFVRPAARAQLGPNHRRAPATLRAAAQTRRSRCDGPRFRAADGIGRETRAA